MVDPSTFNNGFRTKALAAKGTFLRFLHKPDAFSLGSHVFDGSGVPPVSLGKNGDLYIRRDTPGTVNQRLYMKSAGAWAGIL